MLLILHLSLTSPATDRIIDPLTLQLKGSYGRQRISILLDLSESLRYSDIDLALEYSRKAIRAAQELSIPALKAQALTQTGALLSMGENKPGAIENYLKALEICIDLNDRKMEPSVLFHLGAVYYSLEKHLKSLDFFQQALRIATDLEDSSQIASILYRTGMVYEDYGLSEKAASFYTRSLRLSRCLDNHSYTAMAATALGSVCATQGKPEKALPFYKIALRAAKKLPAQAAKHAITTILLDMGNVYPYDQSFEFALKYNHEAIKAARTLGNKVLQAYGYANLGRIYRKMEQYERSTRYIQKAIDMNNSLGEAMTDHSLRLLVAKNHNSLGQYGLAIKEASALLKGPSFPGKLESRQHVLEVLITSYLALKDYQKAFHLQTQLTAVKDSLSGKEKTRKMAEMTSLYEIEKEAQEWAALRQEEKQKSMLLTISVGVLFLLVVIALLGFSRQRILIRKKKTELENSLLHEKQMALDLEFSNKQLTTYTLSLVQKNEILKDVLEQVYYVQQHSSNGLNKEFNSLRHLLEQHLNHENDWNCFKLYFEKVHNDFFKALKKKHPCLTSNDLRICALLRLNMNIKEMAVLLAISPDSAKMARYRLRQKLNLHTEENLPGYMLSLDQNNHC